MNFRDTIRALAVALVLCATVVHAQDQKQNPDSASPLPPIGSAGSGGSGKTPAGAARGVSQGYDPSAYDPAQVTPDQNTLSGAQAFGLGSLQHSHNVFDPAINISELGQVSPGVSGGSTLTSTSLIGGSLSFDRNWGINHLSAVYNGGENLGVGPNSSNSQFHQLTISQQIDWQRWHLLLRDDFVASPGAAFAGTGMGGPGLIAQFSSMLGSALGSFGQAFIPGETIETGNAMRYRNSILGQAEYSFTRRSAFTFSGSYGLLDFTQSGFISSHMLDAQAGYDYLLDPADSVAILASYGKIDYTGVNNSTTNYSAALAYGRKITGRLAFQAAAGPQQIRVVSPTGDFIHWFLSVNSALSYERRRSGVSLSFMRGVGAGSGVFLGATSNTFSAAAHYQLTRFWIASVNGGYAVNTSLVPAGVASTSFNNWFVGANLGRRLGPHAQINFNYGVQKQSSPANCPVQSCGSNGFEQTFGMSFNWHLRPMG